MAFETWGKFSSRTEPQVNRGPTHRIVDLGLLRDHWAYAVALRLHRNLCVVYHGFHPWLENATASQFRSMRWDCECQIKCVGIANAMAVDSLG